MLHVTCDLCGKELRAKEDQHYVVKIEAYAAYDPNELTEEDLEQDNLEAVGQMLQELEENLEHCEIAAPYQNFRYDLCSCCHKKYMLDPLSRGTTQKLDFSKN